jgi:transposase-like protein
MTKPIARDAMYRRRSFDADVIELYLVAMMAERAVEVSHSTILRWVVRYVPSFRG